MSIINSFKLAYLKKLENDHFKVSTLNGKYILAIALTDEGINIKQEQLIKLQENFLIIDIQIQLENTVVKSENLAFKPHKKQSILIITLINH